jgi:hypothetical protein
MGKSRVSIKNKLYNLGLTLKDNTQPEIPVVVSSLSSSSSKTAISNPAPTVGAVYVDDVASELKMNRPLPSVQEKLSVMNSALVALEQPGLRASEVARLTSIIQGVKVYKQLFADFVKYRDLESEVLELRKQLASEKNQS